MDQGGSGKGIIPKAHISPQSTGGIGLPGDPPESFQETSYVIRLNLSFLRLLQLVQRIQGVALDQLLEELAQGLLVPEAFLPNYLPVDGE